MRESSMKKIAKGYKLSSQDTTIYVLMQIRVVGYISLRGEVFMFDVKITEMRNIWTGGI